MSRYTVVWLKDARDELAEIWIVDENRNAVAQAAYEIDSSLADNPLKQGGELSEGLRFFLAPPLRVLFSLNDSDRIVEVSSVRRI
jgi:hypothetical protein